MSGNVYLEAERRAIAARAANDAERARAVEGNSDSYARLAYRQIADAMWLAQKTARPVPRWRTSRQLMRAVLLFEQQWKRECRALKACGLRISGHDATEQLVRRITLCRRAGVFHR